MFEPDGLVGGIGGIGLPPVLKYGGYGGIVVIAWHGLGWFWARARAGIFHKWHDVTGRVDGSCRKSRRRADQLDCVREREMRKLQNKKATKKRRPSQISTIELEDSSWI